VYAVWDDGPGIGGSRLRFARATDQGATWKGIGAAAGGAMPGVTDSGSPELAVASDGTVYIVWTATDSIKLVKSTDGGESFTTPAVVASGIATLDAAGLPAPEGFPEHFRVGTLAAVCVGRADTVVVAWPDCRDGVSRIYCRRSADGGSSWPVPGRGSRC